MWKLVVFLGCVAVTKANSTETFGYQRPPVDEWKAFKLEYKKNYTNTSEESSRLRHFRENKRRIDRHNALYPRHLPYKLALNEFSDMSTQDFLRKYCGARPNLTESYAGIPIATYFMSADEVPNHVDWRRSRAVTHVKHQGECGSCWAFSTTGSLESQHFRSTGELVSLSEQNLIDCSKDYGTNGCDGGFMDQAFNYIIRIGGINTEQSYPYEETDTTPCRFNRNAIGARATGVARVQPGDERALMRAVATVGPISAAIEVTESFENYDGGVFFDPACDPDNVNHAILIVGYGTDPYRGDYWLVKNSWGVGWGERGYVRMARNRNNHCGIASWGLYPEISTGANFVHA